MTAKEWRRRINVANEAWSQGIKQLMLELCDELEALTEPKAVPPVVVTPVVVTLTAVTPPEDEIQT